jgi:hypothetical protein
MADNFLEQLEQRTEQVKITLANLEAEKVRIEGLIAQLQPIVPHYDALVAAERALRDANVQLNERIRDARSPVADAPARGEEQETDTGEGEPGASRHAWEQTHEPTGQSWEQQHQSWN